MSSQAAPNQQKRRKVPRADMSTSSSRDASEEDNDMDDTGSTVSVNAPVRRTSMPQSPYRALPGKRNTIGPSSALSQTRGLDAEMSEMSEGLESPTYDGDVESTPKLQTAGAAESHFVAPPPAILQQHTAHQSTSSNSSFSPNEGAHDGSQVARMPTPKPSRGDLRSNTAEKTFAPPVPPVVVPATSAAEDDASASDSASQGPQRLMTPPEHLSEEDIRSFVQRAIDGKGEQDGVIRNWRANPAPTDRPVRIYADGVYDLFHFGHALQLRQAKLSFPNVHLIVGVVSDELCASHKSGPAMSHVERMESVKHCRWVDEVAADAPWVVDQDWIDRWQIDYVAHDEYVYPSAGHLDVYDFAKKQGKFVPTRRTPAISTSDLLERIVRGYRDGFFDSKLEKNGHPELVAADVDWDSSASIDKVARRKAATEAAAEAKRT